VTEGLKQAMAALAEQMPPVAVSDQVWRRGRRQRRHSFVVAFVAVLAATALVPLALAGGTTRSVGDGGSGAAIPDDLDLPWMWQATVKMDPPGPASVMYSGDGWGLHGTDIFDSEGKVAVAGRRGKVRMLLYAGADTTAGEDAQLSPDGRYVAQGFLADAPQGYLVITDLTTGKNRVYPTQGIAGSNRPVAWRPDGGAVLVLAYSDGASYDPVSGYGLSAGEFALLDVATGAVAPLGLTRPPTLGVRTASLGAFAPDGQRIAVSLDRQLRLIDSGGRTLWSRNLGPRTFLAGSGAFTPDGARIATATVDGCLDECDEAQLAARRWTLGYLDAATGAPAERPPFPPMTAMAIRALGWRNATDLIIERYTPEHGAQKEEHEPWNDTGYQEAGHATLVALQPDGRSQLLLDPPGEVLAIDVPQDLLQAGRFGGPVLTASPFPARRIIWVPTILFGVPAGLACLTALLIWLCIRRRRHQRTTTAPPLPATGTSRGGA
jgi:hypothetical protein